MTLDTFPKTVSPAHFHKSCSVYPNMRSRVLAARRFQHMLVTCTETFQEPPRFGSPAHVVFGDPEEKIVDLCFIFNCRCLMVAPQHCDLCCSLRWMWYTGHHCANILTIRLSIEIRDWPSSRTIAARTDRHRINSTDIRDASMSH